MLVDELLNFTVVHEVLNHLVDCFEQIFVALFHSDCKLLRNRVAILVFEGDRLVTGVCFGKLNSDELVDDKDVYKRQILIRSPWTTAAQ